MGVSFIRAHCYSLVFPLLTRGNRRYTDLCSQVEGYENNIILFSVKIMCWYPYNAITHKCSTDYMRLAYQLILETNPTIDKVQYFYVNVYTHWNNPYGDGLDNNRSYNNLSDSISTFCWRVGNISDLQHWYSEIFCFTLQNTSTCERDFHVHATESSWRPE